MGDEFLREAGAVCQGDRDIVYEDAPPADSVTVYKLLNVFYETAFSSPCVSGNGTEAALALALPIATVALLIKNTYYLTARSWFLHKSDKYAAEGNAAGVDAMHMISFLSYDIVMSLVIAICFYCGSDAVQSFLAIIPAFIIRGISVAAGILPALGFAMLGKILISPKVAPYFLLGFLLAAYLNVPVLGIALLGVIIVALMLVNDQNKPNNTAVVDGGADDDF